MTMNYLRVSDMMQKFKVSRTTIYRWVEDAVLPKPTKIGKTPMWIETDIDADILALKDKDNKNKEH